MLIDLHAHLNYSDGTDSPGGLVRKAHTQASRRWRSPNTTPPRAGPSPPLRAEDVGLDLVDGIELSVKNEGRTSVCSPTSPIPTPPC